MSYDMYSGKLPNFAIIRTTFGREGPDHIIQQGFDTEEELRAYKWGLQRDEVAVQLVLVNIPKPTK